MGILSRHKTKKLVTEEHYKNIGSVVCPYFSTPVIFNADGFNHLQFNGAGAERDKLSQLNKFNLFQYVPSIVEKSGTIQEYRKTWGAVGRKKSKGQDMKEIEYWGFISIIKGVDSKFLKVKVILRRVGTGNIIFWSVMLEVNKNKDTYHLATGDLIND